VRNQPIRIRTPGAAVGARFWILAFLLTGCQWAQPPAPAGETAAATASGEADEAQGIADAALGKQTEVLARGDLAPNGREEVLAVNRLGKPRDAVGGPEKQSRILISRAVVLEKNEGKWSEIFRCDEHLKNPHGYLGGSPTERVSGWQLEYSQDANHALEMRFTPGRGSGESEVDAGAGAPSAANGRAFVVRWNTQAKRYQTFDRSQKRYLNEEANFETPQSILK